MNYRLTFCLTVSLKHILSVKKPKYAIFQRAVIDMLIIITIF